MAKLSSDMELKETIPAKIFWDGEYVGTSNTIAVNQDGEQFYVVAGHLYPVDGLHLTIEIGQAI
jgi:hypothetical protein